MCGKKRKELQFALFATLNKNSAIECLRAWRVVVSPWHAVTTTTTENRREIQIITKV